MAQAFKPFNSLTVPLAGSNLIEASAGTGKTYSIAILVLRLLLHKKFAIREILMVTFTKAAVAELEERIRLFIRHAYNNAKGDNINDKTISQVVEEAIDKYSRKEVVDILKEAVIYLDETSVMTIHSFCQQTLNEFAFETQQLFGATLIQDTSGIIEQEVNKFWRKNITSIPLELLSSISAKISRNEIASVIKNHLDGKRYHLFDPAIQTRLEISFYDTLIGELKVLNVEYEKLFQASVDYVTKHKVRLNEAAKNNHFAKKIIEGFIDDPVSLINAIETKRDKNYVVKLFPDILENCDKCRTVKDQIDAHLLNCIDNIYYVAIKEVSREINQHKIKANEISFDDLIGNLHSALVLRENHGLVSALQKKYKAVFIDEFQDTDKMQYEIFKKAFKENTVLFYIGDPKQSIYAWRKADIATYFKAYKDVDHCYGMNENYRSSESMIKAMNQFFLPVPDFDTFHFQQADDEIKYIHVNPPNIKTKGHLLKNGEETTPITLSMHRNKSEIAKAVARQVVDLLSHEKYFINKNGDEIQIKPSDIGILVRNHSDGFLIKKSLAKVGIPSVTIGEAKVLNAKEATEVLYILEAMNNITRSNINRALLCSFTGYNIENIIELNDELATELFRRYKQCWDNDGIYAAFALFISDFNVQYILLQQETENGERIITNLYQLIELLYKKQSMQKYSASELIEWLKRGIENNDGEGDEYEQRIESDEDAIKISTIHASKGLEYNIVIAPDLDFTNKSKSPFCIYRNEEGNYINSRKSLLTQTQLELSEQQAEQENRRLLYVAITRAVYLCCIFKNDHYKASTLSTFLKNLDSFNDSLIKIDVAPEIQEKYRYKKPATAKKKSNTVPVKFDLLEKNWTRLSYTGLSAENEKAVKLKSGLPQDDYSDFIFNQLMKGSNTGNLLHYIFENLHFTNNEKWQNVIESAIAKFSPGQKELYAQMLPKMLTNVLGASIKTNDIEFNLTEVTFDKRIHEFEFDFQVSDFDPADLQQLNSADMSVNVKELNKVQGIMNGKIDMFFKCKDQYFVLDWKSNYLGDTISAYSPSALTAAMSESNYHLQYLIYTLAAKKYLETRIPTFNYKTDFGGVLYLFLRGMRQDNEHGIFFYKPDEKQINLLQSILGQYTPTEV